MHTIKNYIYKISLTNYLLLFALILRLINENTANFSYFILAIVPFFGRKEIIMSIFFLWLFSSFNTHIVPNPNYSTVLRYLVLLTCCISCMRLFINENIIYNLTFNIITFLFFLFIFAHSLLFSHVLEVSLLRSISWLAIFYVLVSSWSALDAIFIDEILMKFFTIFSILVIISLPFLFTETGYIRNSDGFQGIFNHPQTFGCLMAIYSSLILMLLPNKINSKLGIFLIIISIYFLIASESRTAMFAFLGYCLSTLILKSTFNEKMNVYRISSILLIITLLIFIPLILQSLFIIINFIEVDFLNNILNKSGRHQAYSLFESYFQSRGKLMINSYENINNFFHRGIGFGIASDFNNMNIYRDPYLGIPYGAPVEKGVLLVAVMEEIGFIGFLFFILWLLSCLVSTMYSGMRTLPLFLLIFLINFGESTFFSIGGLGGLLIIFFSLCVAKKKILIR